MNFNPMSSVPYTNFMFVDISLQARVGDFKHFVSFQTQVPKSMIEFFNKCNWIQTPFPLSLFQESHNFSNLKSFQQKKISIS